MREGGLNAVSPATDPRPLLFARVEVRAFLPPAPAPLVFRRARRAQLPSALRWVLEVELRQHMDSPTLAENCGPIRALVDAHAGPR
jgi:hypothetical protein